MQDLFDFIKKLYPYDMIPLHEPVFNGNEKKYLENCIDTTFVSSVGQYVTQFEKMIADYAGAKHAVAVANGTSGLQIALECSGLQRGQEVISQSLTFVGTVNAISNAGGVPVFVDVAHETLGMCPTALREWLVSSTKIEGDTCINKTTGNVIFGIMPVHIFGNACAIDQIVDIANEFHLTVVEDAAESLGSSYKEKHTGTFGRAGVFSFNGNKIITTGGGGCIVTNDDDLAKSMKHITTTAKRPHPYEFYHDKVAYNLRLTNLACALGVAQMEQIDKFLKIKQTVANKYAEFFGDEFIAYPKHCDRNNWLNAFIAKDKNQRDDILKQAIEQNINLRPIWTLMSDLPMYKNCQHDGLANSKYLADRVINLPSSANAKV